MAKGALTAGCPGSTPEPAADSRAQRRNRPRHVPQTAQGGALTAYAQASGLPGQMSPLGRGNSPLALHLSTAVAPEHNGAREQQRYARAESVDQPARFPYRACSLWMRA